MVVFGDLMSGVMVLWSSNMMDRLMMDFMVNWVLNDGVVDWLVMLW